MLKGIEIVKEGEKCVFVFRKNLDQDISRHFKSLPQMERKWKKIGVNCDMLGR